VIDQNIDTVSDANLHHEEMLFGDATQLLLLERANIATVDLMVITTPDTHVTKTIIEMVQHANPQIGIVARVHFHTEYEEMRLGTIPVVCDEEATAEKMASVIHGLIKPA
jgi:CPA2 family monovalent cation:H+ antiporter-2